MSGIKPGYFIAKLLALSYLAACVYLMKISNPNAVVFIAYALLCFSLENERQQKFLADKISKMSIRKIFLLDCSVMITTATWSLFFKLDLVSTLILTALGLLALSFSTHTHLEEMSKYFHGRTQTARTFIAIIVMFPIPIAFLASWVGLTALVCTSVGMTNLMLTITVLISQLFLVSGLGLLALMYFDQDIGGDPEYCDYGWSISYQQFNDPAPKEEK